MTSRRWRHTPVLIHRSQGARHTTERIVSASSWSRLAGGRGEWCAGNRQTDSDTYITDVAKLCQRLIIAMHRLTVRLVKTRTTEMTATTLLPTSLLLLLRINTDTNNHIISNISYINLVCLYCRSYMSYTYIHVRFANNNLWCVMSLQTWTSEVL